MVQPLCDRKMHLGALDRGQLQTEEFNTPKLAATAISRNKLSPTDASSCLGGLLKWLFVTASSLTRAFC